MAVQRIASAMLSQRSVKNILTLLRRFAGREPANGRQHPSYKSPRRRVDSILMCCPVTPLKMSLSLKQRSIPSFQHERLESRSTWMSPEASLRIWMPAIHAGMTNAGSSCSVGERKLINHFVDTIPTSFRASWRYLARPGVQELKKNLDSRLRRNDKSRAIRCVKEFLGHDPSYTI